VSDGAATLAAGLRSSAPLRAFAAFGIEVEYMVVADGSLDVLPVADEALRALDGRGRYVNDVTVGDLGWSNELVAHLLELKNLAPTGSLGSLPEQMQRAVRAMNGLLASLGARLMPTAMHPWMDPRTETRLWPHGNAAIYDAYDRIFDCRRHGWANVQSIHVNLPFGDEREFGVLHEAVRLVMPLLPAIAASSPFAQSAPTGFADYRMELYRTASAAIPLITGLVVPEPVATPAQYEEQLLRPMYRAIEAHDPDGVLQHEWLNARGAIARFDRSAIELRVLDSQECPAADVAVAALAIDAVRMTYDSLRRRRKRTTLPEDQLARVLDACVRDAEAASIDQPEYLALLGVNRPEATAGDIWKLIADRVEGAHAPLWRPFMALVEKRGPLARRLLDACGPAPSREVYAELCGCLHDGRFFDP
jgi:glutamate---cysteine ligase / carboxylate-amine ligase